MENWERFVLIFLTINFVLSGVWNFIDPPVRVSFFLRRYRRDELKGKT